MWRLQTGKKPPRQLPSTIHRISLVPDGCTVISKREYHEGTAKALISHTLHRLKELGYPSIKDTHARQIPGLLPDSIWILDFALL